MKVDLDMAYLSAIELTARYADGSLSPVDVVENAFARIAQVDPHCNAFCDLYIDEAVRKARHWEGKLSGHPNVPALAGIPIAIKDLTPIAGHRTTLGSRAFADHVPIESAVIVERLEAAGAIIMGKTTTSEFACTSFVDSPLFGATRNPWNLSRTSGGSSGGSAVAVITGCVPLAEGSDAGGSIRNPAAFCGCVGLKPSLGRIPFDLLDLQGELIWHTGPLSRTVNDAALFLSVAQGPDDRDMLSLPMGPPVVLPVRSEITGLRIALSMDLGFFAVDEAIVANCNAVVEALRRSGAVVDPVELEWTSDSVFNWLMEFSALNAALFGDVADKDRSQIDSRSLHWIDYGKRFSAVDLKRANIARAHQWRQLAAVFKGYDALLCPATCVTSAPVGGSEADYESIDMNGKMHALDLMAPFNNVSPCPVISIPSGFSPDGMPTAVQIVGRRNDELTVLRIAAALELARSWEHARPPL